MREAGKACHTAGIDMQQNVVPLETASVLPC